MKLDDFVAVSGLPGLFKIVANRDNGLIVEDLDSGKRRFASARKHQFTPLVSIGIYTQDDTAELNAVFKSMKDKSETNPIIPPNSPSTELAEYFSVILPEYDTDKVRNSDIKKVIKWFNFLNDRQLLNDSEEVVTGGDEEE